MNYQIGVALSTYYRIYIFEYMYIQNLNNSIKETEFII